ncbi:uncharacterized protein LAESUDRAFT_129855 [Laetiporus sulphureus 93-53]|uniref:Uncharacterized protein n=1 Tax=Laetiporus sulphureus 93-53 TaxID=1314785 RepID=A0A165EH37_9APHY|nr:uncharacterized protein LAESUDRAFT_129855 [Laetiporus sulphureus 93-53]KZT07040.1 hypothetical protein LAESUDRAFT_129855 [Laetiporus sulphureus 93-53]
MAPRKHCSHQENSNPAYDAFFCLLSQKKTLLIVCLLAVISQNQRAQVKNEKSLVKHSKNIMQWTRAKELPSLKLRVKSTHAAMG